MPRYDSARYDPPAPVAIVRLRPPGGERSVDDVPLLIDTGADATLLPRSAVIRLGIPLTGVQYAVMGFDGTSRMLDAVDLELLLLNKAFIGRYLLTDDEHGVLGRDVLASLILVLDGPGQEWSQGKRGP